MFRPLRRIEKDWGHELWAHNSPLYCGKILVVKPGRQCSFHYHEVKHETFMLVEGRCLIFIGERAPRPPGRDPNCIPLEDYAIGEWHILETGSTVEIQPYQVHSIKALDEPARIIEFSTQHRDGDSYRCEVGS